MLTSEPLPPLTVYALQEPGRTAQYIHKRLFGSHALGSDLQIHCSQRTCLPSHLSGTDAHITRACACYIFLTVRYGSRSDLHQHLASMAMYSTRVEGARRAPSDPTVAYVVHVHGAHTPPSRLPYSVFRLPSSVQFFVLQPSQLPAFPFRARV